MLDDSAKFEKGCAHFNAGDYFEAHEEWEDLWHEAAGSRHAYLQGLIQIATALHHASNGNIVGARKLFSRSLGYLEKAGDLPSWEIDLPRLRDLVLDFDLRIQEGKAGDTLPYFLLPRRSTSR